MEKKRVLLVDDEDDLTTLCGMLLEATGRFVVCRERFGVRALAVAREFRPDLIFLDCNLPDRSGEEISADLRADGALDRVPVVFLTGGLTRAEAHARNLAGDCETIAKPFVTEEFLKRALELVEGLDRLVA